MIWQIKDRQLPLYRPLLMGILNVTPDSFSDGGWYQDTGAAVRRGLQMAEDGADIIDLGAESTRPGAEHVSESMELERLLPVLQELVRETSVPISVDTTKPEVARICLDQGAHIINDVSGLQLHEGRMAAVVQEFGAGLVLMHRRGTPDTMQQLNAYNDLIDDVFAELREGIDVALQAGLSPLQLVLDPGIGFAKDAEQNIELLAQLERFHELGLPVLLGPSRKSFLGHITGRQVHERDYATAAVAAYAIMKGIHILRVHHIEAMKDVLKTMEAIEGVNYVGA